MTCIGSQRHGGGIRLSTWGKASRVWGLPRIPLVPRLEISKVIPVFSTFHFVLCRGTNLPLKLSNYSGYLKLIYYYPTVILAVLFILEPIWLWFILQGLQGTTYTLLVEMFPPRFRTVVGVALELYWALGLMYLSGASYLVPNWRPLELVLSIPTAVTLLYVW
jgi:hypothetical protein